MTSIGFLEIFIILILLFFAFDIKQIAQIFRWLQQTKYKFQQIKGNIQHEFQQVLLEPLPMKSINTKKEWRIWGKQQVQKIPQHNMLEYSQLIINRLGEEPTYQKVTTIGAFYGNLDEMETVQILQNILKDKKTLLLPYCKNDTMYFAQVTNLHQDLEEGSFGIKEPKPLLQKEISILPDLLLIPGVAFDTYGNRLGRGKSFYDTYLEKYPSIFKIGLCLDTQIINKKLPLEEHDQKMDMLISESRTIQF